jgi:phage gp36-like protein
MAYMTADEYLDRYGEQETTRLTDEERTGSYDSGRLEDALSDAQDEADAYIGKRYTIPLDAPPRFVKSIVGAIARLLLHKTIAPQPVRDDAAEARARLKDISRGLMSIPAATGLVVETGGSSLSSTSGDGIDPVFSEESLAGFGVGTGYGGACWRQ